MALTKIKVKPGFDSQTTQTANENGWFDANLVRWRMGLLEKLAGWLRLFDQTLGSAVRSMDAYLDLMNNEVLIIACDADVFVLSDGTLFPTSSVRGTVLTSDAPRFSSTIGLVDVVVNSNAAVSVGSLIQFGLPISIGGRHIAAGSQFAVTATGSGLFHFNMPLAALSTETLVVGFPAMLIDSGLPGAPAMGGIVTFFAHGLIVGNTFHIDQTTVASRSGFGAFTFTLPAGTNITVTSVVDVNHFTFDTTAFFSSPPDSYAANFSEGDNALTGDFGIVFSLVSSTVLSNSDVELNSWFTANLGQTGLVLLGGGPLYSFSPPISGNIAVFTVVGATVSPVTAPQISNAMLVAMPQAQVLLLGTEPVMGSGAIDPLLLRFSDVGTFDVWTATVSNQAGSYRLSRGSKIIGGLQAPQTTLIWTDTDVWSMSYIGPPLVYGFTIMGAGCGLIAPHAAATVGGTTFWMSKTSFWRYSGGGVTPLPCPLWDYIFRDLDEAEIIKVHAGASTSTNEVYFFFPSLQDRLPFLDNWLLFSQDFDRQQAWTESHINPIVSGLTAPDGTTTAQQFVEDSTTNVHQISQIFTKPAGSITTLSVYGSSSLATRFASLTLLDKDSANKVVFRCDFATGNVVTTPTGWTVSVAHSITDSLATGLSGNGWLRYVLTVNTGAAVNFELDIASDNGAGTNYAGNGTSGFVMWGAQVSNGPLVAYIPIEATNNPNECTRYVKYNVAENLWDPGKWPAGNSRTAWIDFNIFGAPLGADGNFRIQKHETGFDDDDQPMGEAFAETGYADLADGDAMLSVSKCLPDMKWFGVNGGIDVFLKSTNYPGGDTNLVGPFSVTSDTQFFTPRLRGRQVAIRFEWRRESGFSARIGAVRFDVKPAGTRP